jgi:uncharacterized protein (TIGR03435 family)
MRRTVLACLLAAASTLGQQPTDISPDLRFEVTSLKRSTGQQFGSGIRPASGGQRYEAINCPIRLMLQVALRVKTEQIVGGPAWLDADGFDMQAKAEKPSSVDELHVMLLNMLSDRLQLKFHHESRDMPIYALTVARTGHKLTPHEAANAGQVWIDQTEEKFLHVRMKATSVPMQYFALRLALLMDRPVIDLTGLRGNYDFNLEYTREPPPGFPAGGRINGEEADTSGPTVYAALNQQLGLELRPQKGAADVVVIDHVEKPSEN